jgi:tetraacyldisaccharide 4'-kinase
MKQPNFWYEQEGVLSTCLHPLGRLYGKIVEKFLDQSCLVSLSKPVLSIGNVVVGGSGKTPITMAICQLLQGNIHVLSRGYGGRIPGVTRVDDHHRAKDVGDEALLLHQYAPTWVGSDRLLSGRKAIASGAEVLLLDDGHQNHSLATNVRLLVVDGFRGFGNGHVMPAGPLRENLHKSLERADAMIILGQDQKELEYGYGSLLPVFHCDLVPEKKALENLPRDKSFFAFCGLGDPEKFFRSLRACDLTISGTESFSDHYFYNDLDAERLMLKAKRNNAYLITTEKDAVRLPSLLKEKTFIFPVCAQFREPEKLLTFLQGTLGLKKSCKD